MEQVLTAPPAVKEEIGVDILVIITKELIDSSGQFYECSKCPLATFMKKALDVEELSVGTWSINDFKNERIYYMTPSFDREDYERVKAGGAPFIGVAKRVL